jgi:FMN phosphatase YigB (HAD superfamily)
VFDIGETVLCEDRSWSEWAAWVGISPGAFLAGLGSVIAARGDHRGLFALIRPGFDFEAERQKKDASALAWRLEPGDLYNDAVPCLEELSSLGYRLGLAGNQPASIEPMIEELSLPIDFVASSARWGVAKPSPKFFERVAEAAGVEASHIAYVGDRLDNDVLPSKQAGMFSVFIRRGPWGLIHDSWPERQMADARIESLMELARVLHDAQDR